jgi:hypothetical protein
MKSRSCLENQLSLDLSSPHWCGYCFPSCGSCSPSAPWSLVVATGGQPGTQQSRSCGLSPSGCGPRPPGYRFRSSTICFGSSSSRDWQVVPMTPARRCSGAPSPAVMVSARLNRKLRPPQFPRPLLVRSAPCAHESPRLTPWPPFRHQLAPMHDPVNGHP